MIECKYRQNPASTEGKCNLGLYGGRPSNGVCLGCEHSKNETPKRKPRGIFERAHDKVAQILRTPCKGCKKRALWLDEKTLAAMKLFKRKLK